MVPPFGGLVPNPMQSGKPVDLPGFPTLDDCLQNPADLILNRYTSTVPELDSKVLRQSFHGKLQLQHNTHCLRKVLEITEFEGNVAS